MIHIQNIDDNRCFKWSLVRYLYPADHHPARISKADKYLAKKFDFKDTKSRVKFRDIHKIERKKKSTSINPFRYENKEKHQIYVSKKYCVEKHVDLLLIGKEGKRHYALIKDFNTFMYDHILHRGRKHFCRCYLQSFTTEGILKHHIKDFFKINGKGITLAKNMQIPSIQKLWKKSSFIIYSDFESFFVPEDNKKQNSENYYENKYQKYIACCYGNKLLCVDD